MATKKTPTKTTPKKPAAAAAAPAPEKAAETVETAFDSGQESLEAMFKAGSQAATKSYEQAIAMAQEQVEKASAKVFESYDDFASFGKESVDAYVASSTVLTKGIESLSKELMGFTQTTVEANVAATKALFTAKSVQEFIDLQSDYSRSSLDALVSESAKLTELSVTLANDAMEPIQLRVNAAVERMIKPLAA